MSCTMVWFSQGCSLWTHRNLITEELCPSQTLQFREHDSHVWQVTHSPAELQPEPPVLLLKNPFTFMPLLQSPSQVDLLLNGVQGGHAHSSEEEWLQKYSVPLKWPTILNQGSLLDFLELVWKDQPYNQRNKKSEERPTTVMKQISSSSCQPEKLL